MDKENQSGKLPDTVAFKDKFTRGFMDSPKEVKEGYYRFKSKTGGYTMLYPKNAKMSEKFYEKNKDKYESLNYGGESKKENIAYDVTITYEKGEISGNIKVNLDLLSDSVGYKGEYKKINTKDNIIYFAKDKDEVNKKNNNSTFYGFFGYIKSNKSNQAIEFIYDITCLNDSQKCNINLIKEEEKAKMLMKSIEFKN